MPDELDLELPPASPRPILVRPKIALEAMCWLPDDPAAVGACIGWLMVSRAEFDHPSGMGATTTVRIRTGPGESVTARPGDWIIRGLKAFMVCDPEAFAASYEPMSEARP